jgi:hypothetical protein
VPLYFFNLLFCCFLDIDDSVEVTIFNSRWNGRVPNSQMPYKRHRAGGHGIVEITNFMVAGMNRVVRRLSLVNEDPVRGCQIRTQCHILRAK